MSGAALRQSAIVPRSETAGLALVRSVARKINEAPELGGLSPEQIDSVARFVILERYKDTMRRTADRERIDYPAERDRYIAQASRTGSLRTKALYGASLARLEAWCAVQGLSVLELDPARADDFIEAQKASGRASSSINLDVSACSAFLTWMARRHPELHNVFRGTRSRPSRKPVRVLAVPSDDEVQRIELAARPELRAAVVVMSTLGLRVGGLPGLSINGTNWKTHSKGKDHQGKLPDEVREAIRSAGLPLRAPFGGREDPGHAARLAKRFAFVVDTLFHRGELRARYSVHDLRHAFAVRHYQAGKDIYATSKALGHRRGQCDRNLPAQPGGDGMRSLGVRAAERRGADTGPAPEKRTSICGWIRTTTGPCSWRASGRGSRSPGSSGRWCASICERRAEVGSRGILGAAGDRCGGNWPHRDVASVGGFPGFTSRTAHTEVSHALRIDSQFHQVRRRGGVVGRQDRADVERDRAAGPPAGRSTPRTTCW